MINRLIEVVCRHGVFALNVSPMGDGSIPDDQVKALADIGAWLAVNGEAIYGSRVWTKAGEGNMWLDKGERYSSGDIRFTTRDGDLYAILMAWPEGREAVIKSLGPADAPTAVALLGGGELKFEQQAAGLKVALPEKPAGDGPYVLRIAGLNL
jgi:alpha-L-fucosidase